MRGASRDKTYDKKGGREPTRSRRGRGERGGDVAASLVVAITGGHMCSVPRSLAAATSASRTARAKAARSKTAQEHPMREVSVLTPPVWSQLRVCQTKDGGARVWRTHPAAGATAS